uniref:Uncharacterized protein n=1 Tax=Pristionchus pacificus TaxID=54126 RepID=A0A2A6BB73_PRIPA|eukprot:PDM63132.1 hypothetical protein PRIPAC_50347 [Pristionchus pacificus]
MSTAVSSSLLLSDSDDDYELIDTAVNRINVVSTESFKVQLHTDPSAANILPFCMNFRKQLADENATPRDSIEIMEKSKKDFQEMDDEGKEEINLPDETKNDAKTGVNIKSENKGTRRSIGVYEIYLFAFLFFVALSSGMMKNNKEKHLNAAQDNQHYQKVVMDIHGLLGKNDILDKEMDLNQKKLDRIIAEMATNNAEIERLKKIENEMMKEEHSTAADFRFVTMPEGWQVKIVSHFVVEIQKNGGDLRVGDQILAVNDADLYGLDKKTLADIVGDGKRPITFVVRHNPAGMEAVKRIMELKNEWMEMKKNMKK